jgi:serine/threonine protein kinase
MSKVIGEGTYGCVHRPSLKCNKVIDYTNKISKLMEREDAIEELEEGKKMHKSDKYHDFSLDQPTYCDPLRDSKNMKAINKCDNFTSDEIANYKLLVMKDGGLNLHEYSKKLKGLQKTDSNFKKMELFWIEAHRLIFGLSKLFKSDVIHHDLKPQNIVYDENKNRINFIDFGLMTSRERIYKEARKSTYEFAIPYWYFPFEFMFLNKNTFVRFVNKSKAQRIEFFNSFMNPKNKEIYKHLKLFYQHTNNSKSFRTQNMTKFYELITNFSMNDYEYMLKRSVETIDIYGTGISLYNILNHSRHLMPIHLYEQLEVLFTEMVTASLDMRATIEGVLDKYEFILENSGIMKKHNVVFIEHKLRERKNEYSTVFDSIAKTLSSMKLTSDDINSMMQPKTKTNPKKRMKTRNNRKKANVTKKSSKYSKRLKK